MSGEIVAACNNQPITSASVELLPGGGETLTVNGDYSLSAMSGQAWTIQPSIDGMHGGAIDIDDVHLVLDAAAGNESLSPEQELAADVTGNGEVTSADAALILQFVANVIPRLPIADRCQSDWVFLPDASEMEGQQLNPPMISETDCLPGTIVLNPLLGNVQSRNFRAILFGDVNESWTGGAAQ